MKYNCQTKSKTQGFIAILAIVFLASCGSYQPVAYANDGIYSDTVVVTETPTTPSATQAAYYENYFGAPLVDYDTPVEEDEVASEVEVVYEEEHECQDDNTTYVSVYQTTPYYQSCWRHGHLNHHHNHWSSCGMSWGWSTGYYGSAYYNGYYGYPYYGGYYGNPYYNGYYGSPYYNGYYGNPYYNGYYGRNYANVRGRRGMVVNSQYSLNTNRPRLRTTSSRTLRPISNTVLPRSTRVAPKRVVRSVSKKRKTTVRKTTPKRSVRKATPKRTVKPVRKATPTRTRTTPKRSGSSRSYSAPRTVRSSQSGSRTRGR